MVAFSFLFFINANVEPKIINISNQIEIWKKYAERNTALECEKKGVREFEICTLQQTEKNTIDYNKPTSYFRYLFLS